MESYLRLIAISLGLAIALGIGLWAFGEGGTRYQLVPLGLEIFTLEVAETPELRMRGLRGRGSVADDGGMVVQLETPKVLTYSTRYTSFPIDILYFDGNDLVIAVDRLKANDERLTASTSPEPVSGALLLPGGTATRLAIRPGYHIQFGKKLQRRVESDPNIE
jgi:uncharacterized membrane protein (UPF0127 family)